MDGTVAANGCDYDGDILFSTNNRVLLDSHITLPAINCLQQTCDKVEVTDADLKKYNLDGMGNAVGTITNRVTSMMEVQSRFAPGTREYDELQYRITCGQHYQQNELDKLKGIVAKPMPASWYNIKACGDDEFLQSICADQKPYFMTYIYEEKRKELLNYEKKHQRACQREYSCSIEELEQQDTLTEEQEKFLFWYHRRYPVGDGPCAMNKICHHIEEQFNGYVPDIKRRYDFDYEKIKVKRRCTQEHRAALETLCEEFKEFLKAFAEKNKRLDHASEGIQTWRTKVYKYYQSTAAEICPNDNERLNIMLDMCYGHGNSMQFFWCVAGELMVKRLEEMRDENVNNESSEDVGTVDGE